MKALDYNKITNKFLKEFYSYYCDCMDKLLIKYGVNSDINSDNPVDINIQIYKRIIKHNLENAYLSNEPLKKVFSVTDKKYNDELYEKYCKSIQAKPSRYKYIKSSIKFSSSNPLAKHVLRKTAIQIHDILSSKRIIRNHITGLSKNPYTNFEELFDIFKNISLTSQEEVCITLYIMVLNINNNILKPNRNDEITEAHELIKEYYYERIEEDANIDVDMIIEALRLINYPKLDIARAVLNKIIIKQEKFDLNKIIIEQEKSENNDIKNVTTPNIEIDKTSYNNACKIIEEYYDINNGQVKRILKMDEILYIVSIMQSHNFSEDIINRFLNSAYQKRKGLRCIDRYLEMIDKINYYKEIEDIASLADSLNSLFREYLTAKTDEDKAFWFSALNDELIKLEDIISNNYSYELSKNKSQE